MTILIDQLKQIIKTKVSGVNYSSFFNPIVSGYAKDDVFVLVVPDRFISTWITEYYTELLREELFKLTQVNYKINFEILPDTGNPTVPQLGQSPQPTIVRNKSVDSLNNRYTFDRFVVGSSNQFPHAACKAVADLPGGHYNPLFIYGGAGLGKTHLLHAVGIALMHKYPHMQAIYVTAEKFMNELINALRYERMPEFRKKYRDKCDCLLIDDIQFLGGKERTQEEFFHTFNTLHDSHRQIVVTSDKLPKDIQGIEDRLRTRFEWGLIADIGVPDLETRIAILKKKGEISNLLCPDDVAMFLASSIKSNIRELEGSLIRVNAFASLHGTALTVDFAREILGSSIIGNEKKHTIESVQKMVADFYKLNISDLKSPRRNKSLSYPRHIAMYLCKKHVRSSFPEIGSKFGGKDHTTVIHACKKIEKQLVIDATIKNDISSLERNLLC